MKNPNKIKNIIKFTNKNNKFVNKYAKKFQDIQEFKYEHKPHPKILGIKQAKPICFTVCYKNCRKTKGHRPCWIDCNMDCLH